MNSKLLELDDTQIDAIINLANGEIDILNLKIDEAINDSYCKYETMDNLCNKRNGLTALVVLLKEKK